MCKVELNQSHHLQVDTAGIAALSLSGQMQDVILVRRDSSVLGSGRVSVMPAALCI